MAAEFKRHQDPRGRYELSYRKDSWSRIPKRVLINSSNNDVRQALLMGRGDITPNFVHMSRKGILGVFGRREVSIPGGMLGHKSAAIVWGLTRIETVQKGVDKIIADYQSLPQEIQGKDSKLTNLRRGKQVHFVPVEPRRGFSAKLHVDLPFNDGFGSEATMMFYRAPGLRGLLGRKLVGTFPYEYTNKEVIDSERLGGNKTFVWGRNNVETLQRGADRLARKIKAHRRAHSSPTLVRV